MYGLKWWLGYTNATGLAGMMDPRAYPQIAT